MPPAAPESRSKYWHIAAGLFAAIDNGEYAPGARLPGENDIMREQGVARSTARQALALLVSWGLAEARKGSGVYVRDYQPIVREGIRRLSAPAEGQSAWADETAGRNLGIDQIEITETEPPAYVRSLLELPPGTVAVLRSRRYTVDGKPVMLSRSWLPVSLAAGTAIMEANTGPGGIYARLRDLGHGPVRFTEEFRARMLPEPDERTERLSLAPATPVMEVIRAAYDAGGAAVEVNEMTADSSAYVFRYDFDAI